MISTTLTSHETQYSRLSPTYAAWLFLWLWHHRNIDRSSGLLAHASMHTIVTVCKAFLGTIYSFLFDFMNYNLEPKSSGYFLPCSLFTSLNLEIAWSLKTISTSIKLKTDNDYKMYYHHIFFNSWRLPVSCLHYTEIVSMHRTVVLALLEALYLIVYMRYICI